MKDVAERAGVSVTTVSHLLNRTRPIAPETEKRILDAIEDLNYHKNVHARRLSMNRSDLLGLIISEFGNPFFPEIITGFQNAAWERGFDILLCNTEYDPERSTAAIHKMIQSGVRGVAIVTSSLDRTHAEELRSRQIGVVFYNLGPPSKLISNVQVDYASGISQAIDYVRQLGHRRVAVIGGPQTNRAAVRIHQAHLEALRDRSLSPTVTLETDYKVDGGVAATRNLLDQSSIPTAIFCGNDLIAMGAMSALEEVGIRVPEDVSVIGFDDVFFARLARPPLTTIRVPREPLGRLCFEALERMLRSKRRSGKEYFLQTELVIRRSTASPPESTGASSRTKRSD